MSRHVRPSVQRAPGSTETTTAPRQSRPSNTTSSRGRTESRHRDHSTVRASSPDSDDEITASTQLFACPYAKYDPDTYSHVNIDKEQSDYRNCSTGYWTSISRLKQHLYRTHSLSQRCTRCWRHFPSEKSLAEHKEKRSCKAKPEPEGLMTLQQHDAISRREHGQEVEKWLKIYQILFPDDDLPGSVYPEWVTGKDLRTCFELLDKAVPTLLYKKFAQSHAAAQGTKPNTTTMFQTNAAIVQEVLEFCKEKFISHMGPRMGPVFADEPLEVTRSHESSSTAQQQRRTGGSHDSSSSNGTSEDEMRRIQIAQLRMQQARSMAQGSSNLQASVSMPFRAVTTGMAEMPMVTQVDPMQPLYQNTGAYQYDLSNMNVANYHWQQQ